LSWRSPRPALGGHARASGASRLARAAGCTGRRVSGRAAREAAAMTLLAITLGILALAAVLGTWRSARIGRRGRWWRLPGSLVLAVGLGLILFPPQWPQDRQDLLVLAPGADAVAALEAYPALPVVALPGVETNAADIEPVPDLATALRHHPLSGRLVVVGDGLSARDREAVRGLNLSFEGGQPLTGIVSLELPEAIHAGRTWTLRGSTA